MYIVSDFKQSVVAGWWQLERFSSEVYRSALVGRDNNESQAGILFRWFYELRFIIEFSLVYFPFLEIYSEPSVELQQIVD